MSPDGSGDTTEMSTLCSFQKLTSGLLALTSSTSVNIIVDNARVMANLDSEIRRMGKCGMKGTLVHI